MISIFNKEDNQLIGEISESQFDFLVKHLEEESDTDEDYWINQDTVDYLADEGAEAALVDVLRQALGDREDVEIHWQKK